MKRILFFGLLISAVLLLFGCSLKEKVQANDSLLDFSDEVVAAGVKLPNQYQGEKLNYLLRYSDQWKKPYITEKGNPTWKAEKPETERVDSLFNFKILEKSDPILKAKSAKEFSEMISSLRFSNMVKIKVTRSEKKETNDGVWFAVEYEGKHKNGMTMFVVQYYFDNGKKIAILTGVFGTDGERRKYEKDLLATVSSLKMD